LMDSHKLTQSALARSTGVPQPSINRILSGVTSEPRRAALVKIADHFGVPVESFYGSKTFDIGCQDSEILKDTSLLSVDDLCKNISILNSQDKLDILLRVTKMLD
ncbi:MAG: helix-turn-helix transcriptional regulator, partial [Porticoccaceae bacterium]|nr:helix-turn-helix transcriptional regulator [Porticoccaceae bacterium]